MQSSASCKQRPNSANGNNQNTNVMRYCTAHVPTARPAETIGDVQKRIESTIHHLETLNYIYVLGENDRLVNVLSIKELYARKSTTQIKDIPIPNKICTVRETADRERAAYLTLKHNIKSAPIVNKEGTFLGVVPADTIQRILYNELREDLMRFAGISYPKAFSATILQLSPFTSVRHRLPWLFIGMAGGILSASIIHLFQATLTEMLLLAAFIPLIVFMNNAVAIQMSAYLIRDLASEAKLPFFRYITRELTIASLLAVCCTLLLWVVSFMMHQDAYLSAVLGLSLFCGILSAIVTGAIFPYVFHRMKLDPADASGPIGTIVQDNLSIIIYFSIAVWML